MTAAHSPTPEELMAYLDGELPGKTAQDVVRHLATCERCQRLADDLRGVSRDARAWHVDGPASSLRLPGAALPAPAATPRWRLHLWRLGRAQTIAPTAAAVVLVVAAIVAVNSRPRRQPTPAESAATDRVASLFATRTPMSTRLGGAAGGGGQAQPEAPGLKGEPQLARTATLRIVTSHFDAVRAAIDRTLRDVGGFVGELSATDAPRSIHATLRVPAARLEAALVEFRRLGRVSQEAQQTNDVTEQVIDLDARIANGKITEKRLTALIERRAGRVADVLEAEREIARVRTELERLEAQRKNVQRRVDYATVTLDVVEETRATVTLGPQPVADRLRHAIAAGFSTALSSLLDVALFFLRTGPSAVLWAMLLGVPAWWFVRRRRYVSR